MNMYTETNLLKFTGWEREAQKVFIAAIEVITEKEEDFQILGHSYS